ncbi:hypothetical protein [Desulfosarcina ovata]|uniref:DUF2802 domain-containing protein n=1 Tax=Desulfosarcina ovata subsp. ovata TaxID=2752305 RepID=A0A5K8A732_9BACT|nr:hypothetical protein [Desulfosarcina ovata]BBO88281.1 hypothetical protein DSCOOX_14610 [Desulfosarcina ovata subsp. ovata]
MLHLSYEICGVILAILLIGSWLAVVVFRSKLASAGRLTSCIEENETGSQHELEHRALVFLMSQKIDTVLAALSQTIEAERQKLGAFVMNPSINEAVENLNSQKTSFQEDVALTPVEEDPVQLQTAQVPSSDPCKMSEPSKPLTPDQFLPSFDQAKAAVVEAAVHPHQPAAAPVAEPPVSDYHQILPMAKSGMDVTTIADELHLPEAEVAMMIRLNAA